MLIFINRKFNYIHDLRTLSAYGLLMYIVSCVLSITKVFIHFPKSEIINKLHSITFINLTTEKCVRHAAFSTLLQEHSIFLIPNTLYLITRLSNSQKHHLSMYYASLPLYITSFSSTPYISCISFWQISPLPPFPDL